MENLNHYNRIQDYLSSKLSDNQRIEFEADLDNNTDLKLEYEATLAANQAIELLGYQNLKRKLQVQQKNESPLTISSANTKKSPWLKMAAAVAFLIIAAFVLFFYLQPLTPEQLAQESFTEPPLLSLRTPTKGQKQTPLSIGEYAYFEENFSKAIKQLSTIRDNDKNFEMAQLTLGATYFQTGAYELAIGIYEKIINLEDSNFEEQAKWNLAMTYLANQQTAKARQLLQQIEKDSSTTTTRKEKIAEILAALE